MVLGYALHFQNCNQMIVVVAIIFICCSAAIYNFFDHNVQTDLYSKYINILILENSRNHISLVL